MGLSLVWGRNSVVVMLGFLGGESVSVTMVDAILSLGSSQQLCRQLFVLGELDMKLDVDISYDRPSFHMAVVLLLLPGDRISSSDSQEHASATSYSQRRDAEFARMPMRSL